MSSVKTLEDFETRQHASFKCAFTDENEKFQIVILVHCEDLVIPGSRVDGVK